MTNLALIEMESRLFGTRWEWKAGKWITRDYQTIRSQKR
jgi:hypothetical protein